jgi:CBS domain-containing protein
MSLTATARDIMTESVVAATPSMTVTEVVELLSEHRISGLPVIGDGRRVVGMITEADVLRRKRGQDTVRALMTTDVVAVSEHEPVRELAFLLSAKRINRVPVLREGKLVGIVSRADVVRATAGVAPS